MNANPTVSVIIPTLNAEKEIGQLVSLLSKQTYPVTTVLVVDSASDDSTVDICRGHNHVNVIEIQRKDFDHGRTRDMALRMCSTDIVVFMTQDAVPAQRDLIKNIIAPLQNPDVAVATARQLPKSDATPMEQLVRLFNYPAQSRVRSQQDIPKLGIKTFFCSDVCAAYNRDIFIRLGGFEYPLKTNEDMFYAAKAINSGYKVAYAAEAEVFHSHNLSLKAQYKRNYLLGFEIEKHKELLGDAPLTGEGLRLVRYVSKGLLSKGKLFSFFHFGFDCVARLAGNKMGKLAAR